MTQVFASGKQGSVLVGTVAYGYKEWSVSMDGKELETSNFISGAYRQFIVGLFGANLSFSGAYDIGPSGMGGNMPLVLGTTYQFTCEVTSTLTLIFSAIVTKIDLKDNIDDVATVSINARVTGSFTSQIA